MMKVTKDKALIFSAIVLIIYIIITEVQIFLDKIPNDALTYAVFAAFGVAETSICAWIHARKKDQNEGEMEVEDELVDE